LITIGFQSRPELDRILGTTSFDADSVTGPAERGGHLF